jgi:hypothetical protein
VLKPDLIKRVRKQGDSDPIDRAALSNFDLLDGDPRAAVIAVRTVIAMERQNQVDDHRAADAELQRKLMASVSATRP